MKCIPVLAIICIYHLRSLTIAQFDKTFNQIVNISFAEFFDEIASDKIPNSSNNDKSIYLDDLFKTFDRSSIYGLELRHVRNVNVFKNATFQDFSALDSLYIREGKINSFPETLFKGLNNLKKLIISHNEVMKLTNDTFADLFELDYLDLSHNQLTHLPDAVFQNLSELRYLIIGSNKLSTLSRDTFVGLSNLERLYLDHNNITSLAEGIFHNVAPGMILDLSFNNVSFLGEGTFADSNNMTELIMSKTFSVTITSLPSNLFSNMIQLKTIEMNHNHFQYLPDTIFHGVPKLKKLNLAYNELTSLNDVIFEKNTLLKVLNLQGNQLQYLSKNVFGTLSLLTELNLASNHLSTLDPQIFKQLSELETISISNNRVNMSGPTDDHSNLYNCPRLKSIYASNNTIPTIYKDWYVENEELKELDLSYNPIPQFQFNIGLKSAKGSILLTSDSFLVFNITSAYTAEINEDIFEKSYLDKNAGCDSNCACAIHAKYKENKLEIRCKRFNEDELEEKFPEYLVNYFSNRYVELVLTNCNLTTVHPLKRIFDQINVTKLSLSSNKLTSLDGLPELPRLEILEVHDNLLTNLDAKILQVLNRSTSLKNITLHENPWNCDCSSINFKEFVSSRKNQISSPNNVTCRNRKDRPLLTLPDYEICHLFPFTFLVVSAAIAIFGIVAAVVVCFYHNYENEIKVWLFSHQFSKWLVTEKEIDRDKKYDAFVSYSHQDEWFVFTQLIANLENGENPYKLCVHYRDWRVGDHIPTQIYKSVAESRRTIIVLSPNFLTSYWARKEFQEAYVKAMAERCPRVIVIMLQDIGDRDKLDDELKAYISTNTYLTWGDPLFWKRLEFVLPHKHGAKKTPNADRLLP